jgi:hypothetical protein
MVKELWLERRLSAMENCGELCNCQEGFESEWPLLLKPEGPTSPSRQAMAALSRASMWPWRLNSDAAYQRMIGQPPNCGAKGESEDHVADVITDS